MTETDAELIIEQEAKGIPAITNPRIDGYVFRSDTATADFSWLGEVADSKSKFRSVVRNSLEALFT